jgi:hypothetical protein
LRSSSIFSFDTLARLPRPTRSLWLTLAICLAFRALLLAGAKALEHIPAPAMNMRYEYLERVHVRGAEPSPRILLMGNSLMRYGLLEEHLAAAAGLEPDEVLNLGVASGRPWEAMLFLRRNFHLTRDVQLVVYNVGRHQIERANAIKHIDRFYRYSTLGEKLAADGWNNRARLLLDYAWPFISERRRLTTWLVGLTGRGQDDFGFDLEPFRPAWEEDFMPVWDRQKAKFARKPPPDSFVHDFALSAQHEQVLRDFVDYWRDRGVKLLLIRTPVRRAWLSSMLAASQAREHWLSFEESVKAMTGGDVAYCPWYTADQCGVDDPGDFLDDSHLTPEGARKLTAALVKALETRGLLPLPSGPADEPGQGSGPILAQKPPVQR